MTNRKSKPRTAKPILEIRDLGRRTQALLRAAKKAELGGESEMRAQLVDKMENLERELTPSERRLAANIIRKKRKWFESECLRLRNDAVGVASTYDLSAGLLPSRNEASEHESAASRQIAGLRAVGDNSPLSEKIAGAAIRDFQKKPEYPLLIGDAGSAALDTVLTQAGLLQDDPSVPPKPPVRRACGSR